MDARAFGQRPLSRKRFTLFFDALVLPLLPELKSPVTWPFTEALPEVKMADPVIYKRKVRYSDSDVQGHVFNVNYFVYFDDAITDFMEVVEGKSCGEPTYQIVLARAECDFRSAGKMGETLLTRVTVAKIGNTSITFDLEITEQLSGRIIARGVEIYVVVDAETMRPMPVPDALRTALEKHSR